MSSGEDHTIPAGTNVILDIFHTHRNPDHFPDPDTFNPDNFLPERTRERHPYAYLPFSAGPRNCIGKCITFVILISIVSVNFNFEKLVKETKFETAI